MSIGGAIDAVLGFWFEETEPCQWWQRDAAFDAEVRKRFGELHARAVRGELFGWRSTAAGRLAEIIVLDQFSRNLYRDRPEAFAADDMALTLAQEAVALGVDRDLEPVQRAFLCLPYMHSELPRIHEEAVRLFSQPGMELSLDFELKHKAIIDRFGRYPHRNEALGRDSTPEELAFLKEPGSSF
ncbi:MAG TPA: DUF924 family protein [Mariprofundaceae bacterium]|nr:DUF924 family protein [Mariprofundaceae bacterium]